jgi:tetratricopeptide (TPR) repeat protein
VDEVVIVDTGSTDRSKSIARAFGARVFDFKWCDDFAAARNEALKRARGEWILYIDADEWMGPADRRQVDVLFAEPTTLALTVRFHPQAGFTAYREYRLFRNDPRIRFRGAIHETVLHSLKSLTADGRFKIGESNLTITHRGYDGTLEHKHRRNLPLLRKAVGQDPDRTYLWWHLGRVLMDLEDEPGAEEAWRAAVDLIRKRGRVEIHDSLPFAELIRNRLEAGVDVSDLLDEATALFPRQYHLWWLKGQALMAQGSYTEASLVFTELAAVDAGSLDSGTVAYDIRIFGGAALDALGTCYFELGRYEESAAQYALAEEHEPEHPGHRIKYRLAAARAKRK